MLPDTATIFETESASANLILALLPEVIHATAQYDAR